MQTKRGPIVVLVFVLLSIAVGVFYLVQRPKSQIAGKPDKDTPANVRPKSITRAVYHENLAGVGPLDSYIIPAHLKSRFAEFEGKSVEVVTPNLDWTEWANGPIVLQEIDDVRALPPPPVAVDVTVQRTVDDEQSVEVLFSFKNISDGPVTIDAHNVQLGFLGYRTDLSQRSLDEGWSFHSKGTGYTATQILYGGIPSGPFEGFGGTQFTDYFLSIRHEMIRMLGSRIPSRDHAALGGKFQLLPEESVPFWSRETVAKPGRHELAVRYAHYVPETRTSLPIRAWKTVEVPVPKTSSPPESLSIHATVTSELAVQHGIHGDWSLLQTIEGRLVNETDHPRHIFTKKFSTEGLEEWRAEALAAEGYCLPGEVQLYHENGQLSTARVEWSEPDAECKRQTIDAKGIPFRFRVWDANWSRLSRVAKIEFWTITDVGLEKLTVAKDIPFVDFPEPEWGPTVEGIRCRIRPLREHYSAREEIRFGFEVESDHNKAVMLHPHVDLSCDGKRVPWFNDKTDWTFPYRIRLPLRDEFKIGPGRHKLQVTVRGGFGMSTDPKVRAFPTFEGTLVSNELEIEVIEAMQH